MSAFLKPVLVLIISILIFAGAVWLAGTEKMDLILSGFYNPSIERSYIAENTRNAELAQKFIFELQSKFALTLNEPAVRSSFLYNQKAEDVFERSRIYRLLMDSTNGLQSVQFVDSNGRRIHFSTSPFDIISQSPNSISYRNYPENPSALSYELVGTTANSGAKITMDDKTNCIIFSFPFFDSMNVYHGTALFTVSGRILAEKLVTEGRIKVSDDVSIIASPPGILFAGQEAYKTDIIEKVSAAWSNGAQGRIILDTGVPGISFSLISFRTEYGFFFGQIINDTVFSVPEPMKIILQMSIFLTLYLTLFFLISFRVNPVIVVQNRIKRLRENLFEQLYINKSSRERAEWILELEQRREEIHIELKQELKLNHRTEKIIDEIIDKSWDELISVIKSGSNNALPVSEETPRAGIEEIEELENIDRSDEPDEPEEPEELDEPEELENIGEDEEPEELEEAIEADEPDELEEIAETEAVERIEIPGKHREEILIMTKEDILSRRHPPGIRETDKTEETIINAELDIVSPFPSMFSALEKEKEEEDKKDEPPVY